MALWVVDYLLLDRVEQPYVLDLVVHLVNLVSWMVKGLAHCIIVTAPVP